MNELLNENVIEILKEIVKKYEFIFNAIWMIALWILVSNTNESNCKGLPLLWANCTKIYFTTITVVTILGSIIRHRHGYRKILFRTIMAFIRLSSFGLAVFIIVALIHNEECPYLEIPLTILAYFSGAVLAFIVVLSCYGLCYCCTYQRIREERAQQMNFNLLSAQLIRANDIERDNDRAGIDTGIDNRPVEHENVDLEPSNTESRASLHDEDEQKIREEAKEDSLMNMSQEVSKPNAQIIVLDQEEKEHSS